jgi:hypothetical protein
MNKLKLLLFLIPIIQFGCSQKVDFPTSNVTESGSIEAQAKSGNGTVQISIPVDATIFNDCTGENVHVVGVYHLIVHQTIQGDHINLNFSENFQDVSGTGETSGDVYSTSSTLHDHITAHKGQTVSTQQKLVMTSITSQFTLLIQLHITINANGTVTAFLDALSSTCELIQT